MLLVVVATLLMPQGLLAMELTLLMPSRLMINLKIVSIRLPNGNNCARKWVCPRHTEGTGLGNESIDVRQMRLKIQN